jgi:hypothetical protein
VKVLETGSVKEFESLRKFEQVFESFRKFDDVKGSMILKGSQIGTVINS